MTTRKGLQIAGRDIGLNSPPFVVAEMSGNHNQSLERALELVDAAAGAGVHALKLQTYTADTITLQVRDNDFIVRDDRSPWAGRSLYDLYEEAHTPWDWHQPIIDRAKHHGLIWFSSPFDESAVDFLEGLDTPAFKIASFEIVHLPLIRYAAATGKPLVISTGMASLAEISDAVDAAREAGCEDLMLLKCTSTYPATPEHSNILTIPHLQKMFGCEVGLSDHTMGLGASVAAVAHGASMIEKHFTLRRADGGVDSEFSLEPEELRLLTTETKRAWQSLGKVSYGTTRAEKNSLIFRRSLYISKDMVAGEALSENSLRIVRPGFGLPPKLYDVLLGKRVSRDVKCGTPVTWNLFGK